MHGPTRRCSMPMCMARWRGACTAPKTCCGRPGMRARCSSSMATAVVPGWRRRSRSIRCLRARPGGGAGGGSLATAKDGELRVGPESAGSAPGPVCYGKGGIEPTVTDANLVLGYIDPDYFLGGKMRLDRQAARRSVERRIARALGVGVEAACSLIRDTVNRNIAAEIGKRLGGEAPAQFTLFAFGGVGPPA